MTPQSFRSIALVSSILAGCGLVNVNGKPAGTSPVSSESSSADSSAPSAGESGGDPHDKLAILEFKIGMPIVQPGFVCAKDAGFYNGAECVKFLDRRCTGVAANIGEKRYGDKAPRGCFMEAKSVATYLDGVLMQQHQEVSQGSEKPDPARYALVNVHTYGTKSTPSKISRIVYTMAMDELASGDKPSGSKLYNALVAKYGAPKEVWSGKVKWRAGETYLEGYCDLGLCTLQVEDRNFEENENQRQEEADAKVRQNNAPAPRI
ncbi:MAG: hypothetical protein IPQ07_28840 [Myxococcales bacterium]|nr:hypothetical protein [Myxococcales bacterium]